MGPADRLGARGAAGLAMLAALAAAGIARGQAGADDAKRARALVTEAARALAAGRAAEACPGLARAHRLDPRTATLHLLAQCLAKEGRTATALATYRALAMEATAAGEPRLADGARRRAAELEKTAARLTLQLPASLSAPAVTLDGAALASIDAPVPLDPGTHEVVVSARGKRPWSGKVQVSLGPGGVTLAVPALEDEPPPPPPPPAAAPPAPVPAPAAAARGPCKDDAECPGKAICQAGTCGVPAVLRARSVDAGAEPTALGPASCAVDRECASDACVDGRCARPPIAASPGAFLGAWYLVPIGLAGRVQNPVPAHAAGIEIATSGTIRYHLAAGYESLNGYQGALLSPLGFGLAFPLSTGGTRFEIEPAVEALQLELLFRDAHALSLGAGAWLQVVMSAGHFFAALSPAGVDLRYLTFVGNGNNTGVPSSVGLNYRVRATVGVRL